MTVIIPHPTEELKLIKFQKELIKILNTEGKIYYAHQPLWLPLPEEYSANTKAELKTMGKNIKQIKILSPEYKNSDVQLPVMIDDKKVFLPLLHFYKKNGSQSTENISLPQLPPCPVSLFKIFRLAISEKTSENSQAVTDFTWIKL